MVFVPVIVVSRRLTCGARDFAFEAESGRGWWVPRSESAPPSAFSYRPTLGETERCARTLLKLSASDAALEVPRGYDRVAQLIGLAGAASPFAVVPPERTAASLRAFRDAVVGHSSQLAVEYFDSVWCAVGAFLRTLVEFEAAPGGERCRVEYDRLATRTGRWIVSSGHAVLTHRAESRALYRAAGDPLYYVDFRALEPTIVANAVGAKFDGTDVYAWAGERILDGADRETAKRAVVSAIYGARFREAERVSSWLQLPSLASGIRAEAAKGAVVTAHGRRVKPNEQMTDGTLVNDWAQSTAVDAAALGFAEITEALGLKPLAVVHDALLAEDPNGVLSDGLVRSISVSRVGTLHYKATRLR